MEKQQKHISWLKNIKVQSERIVRRAVRSSLPEIALIGALIFGKYLKNADFSYPNELIIPVLFFAALATAITFLNRLILRSWLAARVASLLLIYALYSYSYLPAWIKAIAKAPLPKGTETAFNVSAATTLLLAILAGITGLIIARAVKRVKILGQLQLHRIILFTVLFIFTYQAGTVLLRWQEVYKELNYKYIVPAYERNDNTPLQTPDIYYFVFDRYASAEVLKNSYDYDNSDIINFLKGKGFVNKDNAYSNYPFTMQSINSTLKMDYHADLSKQFGEGDYQGAFAYRDLLNNPPVAQVLKRHGYEYNHISSWWDFTRYAVKADGNQAKSFRLRVFGKNFYLSDLNRDILNKSIMSPWLKKGISIGNKSIVKYDYDRNPAQSFFAQRDAIKSIAGHSHSSPQFTFAHFLAPHDPYIFDVNGNTPKYDSGRNDWGADENIKYTAELTFINKQIKDMMGYIREHSPNAVIVIQADEGPYPKSFRHELSTRNYYDPSTLPLEEEKKKFGIMASYYLPGVDEAKAHEHMTASVNPFRFILNEYMGYKFEMLPDCQFSTGNKFTIYTFKNETAKLSGNDAALCEPLK